VGYDLESRKSWTTNALRHPGMSVCALPGYGPRAQGYAVFLHQDHIEIRPGLGISMAMIVAVFMGILVRVWSCLPVVMAGSPSGNYLSSVYNPYYTIRLVTAKFIVVNRMYLVFLNSPQLRDCKKINVTN
jgi:hypothetical protein